METKSIFQSKTLWLNLGALAVEIMTALMADETIKKHPEIIAYMGIAHTVLNIIVRFFTTQPVTLTGAPKLWLIPLLLCLTCSTTFAADINLIVSGGKYYLVKPGDPPTIDRTVTVNVLNLDGITPGPAPIPIPIPVPTDSLTAVVKSATAAIPSYDKKEQHRRAMAESIKFTLSFIRGSSPVDSRPLVRSVCDVATDPDRQKWVSWWVSVDAKLNSMQLTPQSFEAALSEIAAELLRDLPAAAGADSVHGLPPGIWEILLPLIIELIKKWLEARQSLLYCAARVGGLV